MKIRIKGNSLRYRLTKSEVDRFVLTGYIEETVNFGKSILRYSLRKSGQAQLSASFKNNEITVYFPSSFVNGWMVAAQTGFEYHMAVDGSEKPLHILVEKDFTCLDKTTEDQSDNYPNPLLKQVHE